MPGWCQLFAYWTYVSSFLSVWYVVCFSFERYLIIQFPLRRQVLCRPRRAKFVVIGFAVVGMLLYNFAIWTSTTVTHRERNRTRIYCQVSRVELTGETALLTVFETIHTDQHSFSELQNAEN
jgi:7 transmembrane receptor (rhodopsin family)